MVAPAFGFSVGDFIGGIKLLITVFNAFKESGGASSKFASESAFLTSLASTVHRLDEYIQNTPQDDIAAEISKLLDVIKEPLGDFKKFLDKHEAALGKIPTKIGLGKTRLTITYTLKEISGKVEKLRRQVEQPLQAVNSLLALQVLKSIDSAAKEPLKQAQLVQIVEAIKIADIPTELGKQIGVLQRSAAMHEIQNDDQLKRIEEMRENLTRQLEKLEKTAQEIKQLALTRDTDQQPVAQSGSDILGSSIAGVESALEARSDKLEQVMNDQSRLLLALKSFLEDKAAVQETDSVRNGEDGSKQRKASWPPATLPVAHLATVLISAVVSNAMAAIVTKRSEQTSRRTTVQPVVYGNYVQPQTHQSIARKTGPYVTYSPTPNDTSPSTQTGEKTSEISEARPKQADASVWVSDFTSNSLGSQVGLGGSSRAIGDIDPGWSNKLSKLDEYDPGDTTMPADDSGNPYEVPGAWQPSTPDVPSSDDSAQAGNDPIAPRPWCGETTTSVDNNVSSNNDDDDDSSSSNYGGYGGAASSSDDSSDSD